MITDLLSIATVPPVVAPLTATLTQVARIMAERSIGLVVLVDDARRPAGVVTDRDLVTRAMLRELPYDTAASEVMTREVTSVAQDASTLDAARQMATREVRRLPVVNESGVVVGVIGLDDIYRAEGQVLEQINRLLNIEHGNRARL